MSLTVDEEQRDLPVVDDGQALEDDDDGDGFLHLNELEGDAEEDLTNAEDDGVDDLDELNEEEHEALLEETAVVRDTIAKVGILCYRFNSLTDIVYTAPQVVLCHNQLHYHRIAQMTSCLCHAQSGAQLNTTRCCHKMEFDI